jgi:hypothetical protein
MRERRDIHGDPATGHHRQREHTLYRDKDYGMTMADFKQGDMLGVASKSVIGVVIREFSMVDGKSASVNHFGQVIRKDGMLVVSEANYPKHKFTKIADYLGAQRRGKCRLTLVRLNKKLWATDTQRKHATEWMTGFHLAQKNVKYTVGPLIPMALYSAVRNITPFIRGRFKGIPTPVPQDLIICSALVDWGWHVGQLMTKTDFFPSSLGGQCSPQDILESPHVKFIGGWKKERI